MSLTLLLLCFSMIVPVYQSEISEADNVSCEIELLDFVLHTDACRSQRGKLACIEFTGNIAGYASSVVSYRKGFQYGDSSCSYPLFNLTFAVDRLLLLIHRL